MNWDFKIPKIMNSKSNSRMKKKIFRQTNKKDVIKRVAWWLRKMKVEEKKKRKKKCHLSDC